MGIKTLDSSQIGNPTAKSSVHETSGISTIVFIMLFILSLTFRST